MKLPPDWPSGESVAIFSVFLFPGMPVVITKKSNQLTERQFLVPGDNLPRRFLENLTAELPLQVIDDLTVRRQSGIQKSCAGADCHPKESRPKP